MLQASTSPSRPPCTRSCESSWTRCAARAAIRDSPCVKRTDVGDEERGFEGQVGHGVHMAQRGEPPGVRLVVLVDIASLSDTDCLLELVQRPATQRGLMVQPKRWIVERTFGWF